jgi:hypothetical protein
MPRLNVRTALMSCVLTIELSGRRDEREARGPHFCPLERIVRHHIASRKECTGEEHYSRSDSNSPAPF